MNQLQNLLMDCLIDTKHVENAAILTAKNGTVSAASPGFNIKAPQAQMFIDSFQHTAVTRESGFRFQSKHYTCVRADRNSIYSKSNGHGLILVKTAVYIIVATYNENMYASVCVEAVEKLAEYLREKGK
ncbi:profilin-4 [Megalops cyprinoides]|uniref:profilin-4 n=1 Tax=Megalops cyprinoides TaxID=118141 RepID=UPI001864EC2E|nr:profilin-4 [Megalops cyprinoides]